MFSSTFSSSSGHFWTFILSDDEQQRSLRLLSDPTLLLCGKLCEELLNFILEHPEPKLQRMTNRTISKYELADNKCRRLQVWWAGEHRQGNEMASISTRNPEKLNCCDVLGLPFALCHPSPHCLFVRQKRVEPLRKC